MGRTTCKYVKYGRKRLCKQLAVLPGLCSCSPGRLTFQPLFLERDFLLIWPLTFAFMCAYFTFIVSANWAWLTIIPMAVCFITFGPGIHGIRRSYLEQEQMLKDLGKFDVSTVSCANDFDKQFILEAISKWHLVARVQWRAVYETRHARIWDLIISFPILNVGRN